MSRTRAFRFGNSQAVRIPAELAYDDIDVDLRISRVGDVITIFPAHGSLKDAISALRKLPTLPLERRQAIDVPTRRRG